MDTLTKLAIKHKTDKWGKHHYTPFYYNLFKDRRESVKKVLEIGVGEGASLRMWRDFFPNAMIYGADNDKSRIFIDPPIQVFRCDQSKTADLRRLIEKTGRDIDLVVDDGSHEPEDQLGTYLEVIQKLDKPSIYVIEDVADPQIVKDFCDDLDFQVIKCGKRYDDRLIIVKK